LKNLLRIIEESLDQAFYKSDVFLLDAQERIRKMAYKYRSFTSQQKEKFEIFFKVHLAEMQSI
jgi:two-component sensor histidine kinase